MAETAPQLRDLRENWEPDVDFQGLERSTGVQAARARLTEIRHIVLDELELVCEEMNTAHSDP